MFVRYAHDGTRQGWRSQSDREELTDACRRIISTRSASLLLYGSEVGGLLLPPSTIITPMARLTSRLGARQ